MVIVDGQKVVTVGHYSLRFVLLIVEMKVGKVGIVDRSLIVCLVVEDETWRGTKFKGRPHQKLSKYVIVKRSKRASGKSELR